MKFIRCLFRRKKPPSALKQELINLRKKIVDTDDYMGRLSDEFWRGGGVCCPGCGVEGYADLQRKQDRREKRIAEIIEKIERDSHDE